MITCRGTVDLSPGRDEDVNAGVGVGAGDVRGEQVEVDVLSPGRQTEHQTTLLIIYNYTQTDHRRFQIL